MVSGSVNNCLWNEWKITFLTILRSAALQLDISKDCASEVCSIWSLCLFVWQWNLRKTEGKVQVQGTHEQSRSPHASRGHDSLCNERTDPYWPSASLSVRGVHVLARVLFVYTSNCQPDVMHESLTHNLYNKFSRATCLYQYISVAIQFVAW